MEDQLMRDYVEASAALTEAHLGLLECPEAERVKNVMLDPEQIAQQRIFWRSFYAERGITLLKNGVPIIL
jgi:hypothetical protein